MRVVHAVMVGTVALIGACHSKSGANEGASAGPSGNASFDGIYAVERITRNPTGCATEGPVVDPEVKYFFLQFATLMGSRFLWGGGQTDVASCVQLVQNEHIQIYYPLRFSHDLDSAELTDVMVGSGIPKGGMCQSSLETQSVRFTAPNQIRIELRTVHAPHPGKTFPDCGIREARQAAAGKPCDDLTVIVAHRDQPLPVQRGAEH
jgi:hypothetical protein